MDDDFGPELIAAPACRRTVSHRRDRHAQRGARRHQRRTADPRPAADRHLVYRLNHLIYANRAFLDWTGYPTLDALAEAGGLDSLFIETKADGIRRPKAQNGGKTLTITTPHGQQMPVEGRLFSVTWNGENALVLMLNTLPSIAAAGNKDTEAALRRVEDENQRTARHSRYRDRRRAGARPRRPRAVRQPQRRGAVRLRRRRTSPSSPSATCSRRRAAARRSTISNGWRAETAPVLLNDGREVIGRVRQGGLVPLYMTMGRIEDGEKFCAVLRDITAWKRTEEELINARQQAEKASTAKSEFLAKISHEIRTPLNAIIGFSEVMMEERFGPIGNERYRHYLKDIHTSGGHLISLLNDLLDLSKIEAGKLELTFVSVNLNDLVQQCVAIMQQQANRERVIIRTSLAPNLPQIVADARSVRQIVLNLLSNSIKFTGAGGQVIVSTALTDDGEVGLRVRDTGVGMSEKELQTALEPFRQLATSARWGSSGTGLGLPITKALAEANHARFRITSEVETGTLVEVAFPATRVLAQ